MPFQAAEDITLGDFVEVLGYPVNGGVTMVQRARSEPTMAEMLSAQEKENDKLRAEVARLEGIIGRDMPTTMPLCDEVKRLNHIIAQHVSSISSLMKGEHERDKVIAEKDKVIYELNCTVNQLHDEVGRLDSERAAAVRTRPSSGQVDLWKRIESEAKRLHEMHFKGTHAQYEDALRTLLDHFEIPF